MKRSLARLAVILLALTITAGCSTSAPVAKTADGKIILKVGTLPVPHSEILAGLAPLTEQAGLAVETVDFTDVQQANTALAAKQLDAVYAQSALDLEASVKEEKLALVSVGRVHLEPYVLCSTRVLDLADLRSGARIAIPNDPAGTGRALNLLAQRKLIDLKDVGTAATLQDVIGSPKQLVVEPVDWVSIPRMIEEYDAAVISAVQVIEAKEALNTWVKALKLESSENNPYVNVLAVRKGDEQRPEIQKLATIMTSEQAALLINNKYPGKVISAQQP